MYIFVFVSLYLCGPCVFFTHFCAPFVPFVSVDQQVRMAHCTSAIFSAKTLFRNVVILSTRHLWCPELTIFCTTLTPKYKIFSFVFFKNISIEMGQNVLHYQLVCPQLTMLCWPKCHWVWRSPSATERKCRNLSTFDSRYKLISSQLLMQKSPQNPVNFRGQSVW